MTKVLEKPLGLDVVEKTSMIYSNSGNLIIPIVTAIFGKEWVIYSTGYLSVQTILLWSHGRMMICEEKGVDFRKIFMNIIPGCFFRCSVLCFEGDASGSGAGCHGFGGSDDRTVGHDRHRNDYWKHGF